MKELMIKGQLTPTHSWAEQFLVGQQTHWSVRAGVEFWNKQNMPISFVNSISLDFQSYLPI